MLVSRNADRLSEMSTELKERHAVNVETIVADLAVRDEVVGIAERLTSVEQPIDMLINNADGGGEGSPTQTPPCRNTPSTS